MYDFRVDRGQGQDQDGSDGERDIPIHLRWTVVRSQVKEGRREGRSTHNVDSGESVGGWWGHRSIEIAS